MSVTRVVKLALALSFVSSAALAQAPAPSYGPDVTIEQAKKIAAASLAEAKKNNWNMAIAIVNTHGSLVYFERMDDTQTASTTIAIEKARTAAMYRRPTRALEDAVNKGRPSVLNLSGVMPIAGGLPIVNGGKIGGAIGASGGTADQDEQVAKAGSDLMK
jgi:uncharacterized protein GlcG (DUF336 family)